MQRTESTHLLTFSVPCASGITRIPAVVIQIFDPETNRYQTLRSQPIAITVDAAAEGGAGDFVPRIDSEAPVPLHGVRQNRVDQRMMTLLQNLLEFFGHLWWLWVPVPLLMWVVLRPVARRWERSRRDPVFARTMAAWSRFRRMAPHDEEAAWRTYLADRLALCREALTADSVTQALRTRQVDAQLITETRRRLQEKDAEDYGRRPAAPAADTINLVRRLQKATVPWLMLLAVLTASSPLQAAAKKDGTTLFKQAMEMRAERPDEAQPRFVEAALQFESEDQFVNAGNSWYFAGETGRALASYRAAQRRRPFDRQLHESIAFLRASRIDSFPPPSVPVGVWATWWRRFCTWEAALRGGLFVVVYLVAWSLFLAAKLGGWRVHRAVWVLLFVAATLPLISLVQSSWQPGEGVVVADSLARLGPGYAYDPAFKEPLHQATEFTWVEQRQGWVHGKLPDGTEGWLPESACMKVR